MRQRAIRLSSFTGILVLSWVTLRLVPLASLASEPAGETANKPELILVNIKVTDKKTGRAIDDADVQVRWGEGEEDHSDATTNSKGIARCKDVPRGRVVIRVIANGYEHVAPTVDLKSEEQPIKIELDKRHVEGTTPPPPGRIAMAPAGYTLS